MCYNVNAKFSCLGSGILCFNDPTMTNRPRIAPRLTTRRKAAPKPLYTYCPFRPGLELKRRLDKVATRSGLSVSEVVRRCCAEALPALEGGAR